MPAGTSERAPGIDVPGDSVIRSCIGRGPALLVELQGEVDDDSAGPLRVLLHGAAAHGCLLLSLDTRLVPFADSALLNVIDSWTRRGRALHLGARSPAVDRLLDATRAGTAPSGGGPA
ncbi:STAS domain-containing protein [Streptomyces zhihengii]